MAAQWQGLRQAAGGSGRAARGTAASHPDSSRFSPSMQLGGWVGISAHGPPRRTLRMSRPRPCWLRSGNCNLMNCWVIGFPGSWGARLASGRGAPLRTASLESSRDSGRFNSVHGCSRPYGSLSPTAHPWLPMAASAVGEHSTLSGAGASGQRRRSRREAGCCARPVLSLASPPAPVGDAALVPQVYPA